MSTKQNNNNPALALRSSTGVELWNSSGFKEPLMPMPQFIRDESKLCRTFLFSDCGRYFAYSNGTNVNVCLCNNWKIIASVARPKAFYLKFSPLGNYLIVWESFTTSKDHPEGSPNLHIYKSEDGTEMLSIIQKRNGEWEPYWSQDEQILSFMMGGEAYFYEPSSELGFTKYTNKIGSLRNGMVSLSPGTCPPFVAVYLPGVKDAPSMCKIFQYPNISSQTQPIACKSFFQADRMEMIWNKRGNGLLLLTICDVDKTNSSYYGKQSLYFMSTRGDSFAVNFNKDGPVHSVAWNPKSTEFCAIYGFMPTKVGFFNAKCDLKFEIAEGARNSIYYNPFGNLVILAGFGNVQGQVEIWNVAEKKQITALRARDTTHLEWCPNGITFVTATTAPRLRISNGFKIWHYSGALLHETLWPTGQELLQVTWQKFANGIFTEQPISNVKIVGIVSVSNAKEASTEVYRPPCARKIDSGEVPIIPGLYTKPAAPAATKKQRKPRLRDLKNKKDNETTNATSNNSVMGAAATAAPAPNNSSTAGRPIVTPNKQQINSTTTTINTGKNTSALAGDGNQQQQQQQQQQNPSSSSSSASNKKPPNAKKTRKYLEHKIQIIEVIKSQQQSGSVLNELQLEKLKEENSILQRLKDLAVVVSGDHN